MALATIKKSPSTPKTVRFQLNYNLRSLFLKYANEKDRNSYEDFLCYFKGLGKEIRDDDLVSFLSEARGCISILSAKFKLFVELILIYQWAHRSQEVINEYQGFLLDLCSAHCDYTKPVIDHLVNYFKSDADDWNEDSPGEKSIKCYEHIHYVTKSILSVIPMSRDILVSSIRNCYPYIKRPATEQRNYVYNLLEIVQYEPSLLPEILNILIVRLINLDSLCPREELEQRLESQEETMMEIDEDSIFQMEGVKAKPKQQISEVLDVCLLLLYKFIKSETHDEIGKAVPSKVLSLYRDLIKVFETVILQTHSNHVQFIMFYLLSLRPALAPTFIETLWKMVSNVNVPAIIRQAAVSYMASFITRATFLPLSYIRETMSKMSHWIHSYINNEDGPKMRQDDIRIHGVFYTTCQALFYIIAFLHKDLVQATGLSHLQSLSLSKIVTCRLNPLKVCYPDVVKNFSSVSRSYQLAYCNTIIERNSRFTLPTVYQDRSGSFFGISHISGVSQPVLDPFFPFDPYLLPRSKSYISPIYRLYSGPSEESVQRQPAREDDDDDFLDNSAPENHSALEMFSYSTSPGFIHHV